MDSITAQMHASFSGGTLVHTENGLVPIQEIKVGERVLSRDEQSAELTYQLVNRVVIIEKGSFVFLTAQTTIDFDDNEQFNAYLNHEIETSYVEFLATTNLPFWVEDKGWVAVEDLESGDVLLDKEGKKYTLQHPGYDGDVRAKVYKTAHSNIGFMPNYGLEYSQDGSYIDLTTGKPIQDDALQRNAENDPTLAKLYQNNPEWEQDLREELGVPAGEPAEFFGFKTGEWIDPSSIDKNTLATTTVYNLEVANTHTYFVGEEGIWVRANVTAR